MSIENNHRTKAEAGRAKIPVHFIVIFLFCLLSFALSGCSDADGMANVQREYGVAEVVMIPGKSGSFIARKDDGSIWYAFSSGIGDDVISQVQLMSAR